MATIIRHPQYSRTEDYIAAGIGNFLAKWGDNYKKELNKKIQDEYFEKMFKDKLELAKQSGLDYSAEINPADMSKSIIKLSSKLSSKKEPNLSLSEKRTLGELGAGGRFTKDIKGREVFQSFNNPTEAKNYAQTHLGEINPKAVLSMSDRYGKPVAQVMDKPVFMEETYSPDDSVINPKAYMKGRIDPPTWQKASIIERLKAAVTPSPTALEQKLGGLRPGGVIRPPAAQIQISPTDIIKTGTTQDGQRVAQLKNGKTVYIKTIQQPNGRIVYLNTGKEYK